MVWKGSGNKQDTWDVEVFQYRPCVNFEIAIGIVKGHQNCPRRQSMPVLEGVQHLRYGDRSVPVTQIAHVLCKICGRYCQGWEKIRDGVWLTYTVIGQHSQKIRSPVIDLFQQVHEPGKCRVMHGKSGEAL